MTTAEINQMADTVASMLSTATTDVKEVRKIVACLAGEGIGLDTLVNFLIHRKHERQDEGLPPTPTMADLKEFLEPLTEPSPENLKRWETRFKSGEVECICPRCGFSGHRANQEGRSPWELVFVGNRQLGCPRCSLMEDSRYFTRKWTAEEQAAFEVERRRYYAARDAEETRKREERQRVLKLEPKVQEVVHALEDYVDEQQEVEPYIRTIVQQTVLPVETIVRDWQEKRRVFDDLQRLMPKVDLEPNEKITRKILGERTMREVLEQLDLIEAGEPDALQPGDERFFFTREEITQEFTTCLAKWDSLLETHDVSTGLSLDGKFYVTVHAKGYAEEHPCPCEDCRKRAATKQGSNA